MLPTRVRRGQEGINLIERIVLQMGSSWSPTGSLDVGIDGYIELFDPATNEALGKILAVQSRVLASFANETGEGFDYSCDERDLTYWLDGNMPVLLIVSRPERNEAYWISIKDYFSTPERRRARIAHFAKVEQRFDASCLQRLLHLGHTPNSGLYLGPMPREERLISNLLPLVQFPPTIWIAATDYRRPEQLFPILNQQRRHIGGDWALHDRSILSFQDLSAPPWNSICDQGTCEAFSSSEWAFSKDEDRRHRFVELLNLALKEQLYPHMRYWFRQECFAFTGTLQSAPVKIRYRAVFRDSAMTVVAKYSTKRARDGQVFTCLRHLGFHHQFRLFGDRWCLEITPTYVFTDGVYLDRFHEERLKGIKRIEGNRAVLSSILLLADFLARRDDLLSTDRNHILEFGELLDANLPFGIDDGAWADDGPEQGGEPGADIFDLLAAPGVKDDIHES